MRDLVGRPIGNFVIVSRRGAGTFGVVYLARHQYLNERQSAITFLHAQDVTTAQGRAAFLKEAHTLERLRRPSILAIDDFGFFDNAASAEQSLHHSASNPQASNEKDETTTRENTVTWCSPLLPPGATPGQEYAQPEVWPSPLRVHHSDRTRSTQRRRYRTSQHC